MLLFVILALIAFFVSASMPNRKWVFWVAIFLTGMALFTLPAGLAFPRRSDGEERFLIELVGGGLVLWQRERLRPVLKQWGIIAQWERLKAKLAEQRAQTAPPREEPQTDEEQEKDRQFRIAVGERFGELEAWQIVRGVWETVTTKTSVWVTGTALAEDAVEAVHIAIVKDSLLVRSEKKTTYQGALQNPLQPDAQVSRMIDLAEINSIELTNSAQYHGDNASGFGTNDRPSDAFKKRHPYIGQSKGKTVFIDYSTCWIVFAFLASGDRVPLLRAWDYDACVKWRTQIANLVQAERMKVAQTQVESDEDYL